MVPVSRSIRRFFERSFSVVLSIAMAGATAAIAQQPATPAPGSAAATRTLDGKYLPPQPPAFGGVINLNAAQSKPWWPPRVAPPKGAPNVLLIMTDDCGFGAPSTFGGVIPTPALDRVAKMGLRYTRFHSTALCSPTRAALITGRNHHSVGFGQVSEMATGFPGYDSYIGRESATLGRVLKDNGYATSWFGKDHNTPAFQASQVGPFDQWPIGMGFEYFYGFVGGDTSQWQPNLFRNTTAIYPYVGKPEWNLVTAMADDAIAHLKMLNEVEPDKPFFCYYVPGATHAPPPCHARMDREVQGQVRHGLEQAARPDLRQSEEAGGNSARREADPLARHAEEVGRPVGRREKALYAASRSVCRIFGLRRS